MKIRTENTDAGDIPESVIIKKTGREDLEPESALNVKEDLEDKKHAEGAKNNTGQGLGRKLEITRIISNGDSGVYQSTGEARHLIEVSRFIAIGVVQSQSCYHHPGDRDHWKPHRATSALS